MNKYTIEGNKERLGLGRGYEVEGNRGKTERERSEVVQK